MLADRVGIVFGLRAGEEPPAALSGFPELDVGPLPPETQKELIETPLTANTGLVWNGDLPRQLQQIRFDTADGINLRHDGILRP